MKHFRTFSLLAICLLLAHLAPAQTSGTTAVPAEPTKGSAVLPAISGSGTTNYIPIWTSSTGLGNSKLYQTGGHVGIGTTTPAYTLDVAGHINTSLDYRIGGTTVIYEPGGTASQNITLGYNALTKTTGIQNTAIGDFALELDTTGGNNTANGDGALNNNMSGSYNAANGADALANNNSGNYNTASGFAALFNNTTGGSNTAIGIDAGYNVTGSNNIEIGNTGTASDNGAIRIGDTQTSFFVAGVSGVATGLSGAVPVLIDSNGQLGTISSSRRFKTDIQDIGDASRDLMRLRPVTFRYKKPFADGSQPMQYGLIAEEVAEVYPDLVAYSADGQIEAVKYQLLDPMLLNEVQRQHAEIQELQERLSEIRDLQEQLNQMKEALAAMSHAPGNQ